MSSPSEIASFGHSGSHAPQLMHSSVIIVAIVHWLLLGPSQGGGAGNGWNLTMREIMAGPFLPRPDRSLRATQAPAFAGQFVSLGSTQGVRGCAPDHLLAPSVPHESPVGKGPPAPGPPCGPPPSRRSRPPGQPPACAR